MFQNGTAVHEKSVAQRRALPRVIEGGTESPLDQHFRDSLDGFLHGRISKDFLRQSCAIEFAKAPRITDSPQQNGKGHQMRTAVGLNSLHVTVTPHRYAQQA